MSKQQEQLQRVGVAMQYASMMRSTTCRHHAEDDEPGSARVCTGRHEAGAYNAACEVLRMFFQGELGVEPLPDPPGGTVPPDEPPATAPAVRG